MTTKLLLTPNEYSRPMKPMNVRGIVLHWVENPGQSARSVMHYFEQRKEGKHGYGSAHYIVDDEEIIQCIPWDEMAYHVGAKQYTEMALKRFGPYPNSFLIGIELCHPDWTGKPTAKTLFNAEGLCCDLCMLYHIDPVEYIVTHYQITNKVTPRGPCPKWFIEHPSELDMFRLKVKECIVKRYEHETIKNAW